MKIWSLSIVLISLLFSCTKKVQETSWVNPIRDELNTYGMKDFFIFTESDDYYLIGSEYPNPFKTGQASLHLYNAEDFNSWREVSELLHNIPTNAWYLNMYAPEILKLRERYYLTFNARNNLENKYQKTGFGIAVSDEITGPYTVINSSSPIVKSNHGTIDQAPNGEFFLTYDMDGRIYSALIDLANAKLLGEPTEMLGPESLGEHFKFLDAPNITKIENTYHLLFTQFYGGYIVRVNHMTADHPSGPWKWRKNNPVYEFLEVEADMKVKMDYPEPNGFAPPTQVIFSHTLFKGLNQQYFMAYHSSEKYSEPYLCIEPVELRDEEIYLLAAESLDQKAEIR